MIRHFRSLHWNSTAALRGFIARIQPCPKVLSSRTEKFHRCDVSTVRMLLADREFIGQKWWVFLVDGKIPFAIRMKEDQIVRIDDGRKPSLHSLRSVCKGRAGLHRHLAGAGGHADLELHFGVRILRLYRKLPTERHGG